jgi:hypothetical protein
VNTKRWAIILSLFVTLAVEPMSLAHATGGTPEHPLNAAAATNLNAGWGGALNPGGWQVAPGAERNALLDPADISPAEVSANGWMALGPGVDGNVSAIAASGSALYVVGDFISVGSVTVNHIAKWDGSTWSALGSGTVGSVWGVAASGSDVYVIGGFTSVGGVPANHIAKWDGSAWSALGGGLSR